MTHQPQLRGWHRVTIFIKKEQKQLEEIYITNVGMAQYMNALSHPYIGYMDFFLEIFLWRL